MSGERPKQTIIGWACNACGNTFTHRASERPKVCPKCKSADLAMKVGRLAMRHEGKWWNAYYAQTDTMQGAILLGSVGIHFVETPERRDQFIAFMREAVADIIEETSGTRPRWPEGPQPAPEHEKAGHS